MSRLPLCLLSDVLHFAESWKKKSRLEPGSSFAVLRDFLIIVEPA
jgi:hypothetical protein